MGDCGIIVKTRRGLENVIVSHLSEVFENCNAIGRPFGFAGIVFVECSDEQKDEIVSYLLNKIAEAEKVLPVYASVNATIDEIASAALEVAKKLLKPNESFAVRTTRRGSHDFTSVDVNIKVGAVIKEELGNPVNLDYPDKVIWIEIFNDKAYISITSEQKFKKPKFDKTLKVLKRITIVQIPFLGNLEGAYRMGVRIGRAAQAFEIAELVIAPMEPVDALEFSRFLAGVLEGIDSRFEIQKKTYHRTVKRIKVRIYELYQYARMKRDEVLIITSAKGKKLDRKMCKRLSDLIESGKRINIFIGAREGIPSGLFRWADEVVNLAPGITFATEHGIPASIIALLTCLSMEEDEWV